jgi:hypothetical protein
MSLTAGGSEGEWPWVLAMAPTLCTIEALLDFDAGEAVQILSSFSGADRRGRPASSCVAASAVEAFGGAKWFEMRVLTSLMVFRQTSDI